MRPEPRQTSQKLWRSSGGVTGVVQKVIEITPETIH